jgi:uncharacterized protein (TIRG00374 family)
LKRIGWRGVLGIAVSAICLYFAFRNFHWREAANRAKQANYGLLLLATIAATGMFPLRARRWRTILDPVAPRLPFGPLWRSTAIGVMITNVTIARAGEIARPIALIREIPSISFPTAFASVVVDRLFDAMVVLLLLAVSLVAPGAPSGVVLLGQPLTRWAVGFAILPLLLLSAAYALAFFPAQLIRLFELLARRVHPVVEGKGRDMLLRFADGLSVLRNPRHFVAVFFWTLLHWLLQPLAFWLGLRAFGIAVPWSATLFLQFVIVILVSVPSTPGFFGPFELAAKAALPLYGASETAATTWALVFHLASFVPITVIGAYYFARAGLTMRDIGSAERAAAP